MSVHLKNHEVPTRLLFQRRMSICGETFNPCCEDNLRIVSIPKTPEQKERIEECICDLFLFQNLDKDQYEGIIEALQEKKVDAGEYVVKEGDDGKCFYIIEEGVFQSYMTKEDQEVLANSYEKRGYFGELYLLYGEPLRVTVKAVTCGTLWFLDRFTYTRIVIGLRSKKLLVLESYLSQIPSLKKLKWTNRSDLATVMKQVSFTRGQVIIKQGDPEDGLYILTKGALKLKQLKNNGQVIQTREINPGFYFGEKSLTSETCWPSTITAESNVDLAYISRDAYERTIEGKSDEVQIN